jgi:VWFA-related protein
VRGALPAFGALVLVTLALHAQSPSQPTFRTDANYVRVDVFPTRNGVPVADLTQADFEIVESGVRQRIEQFERVVIRGNEPQERRTEPNTVRESRAMAADSRARVFVIFLDSYHVDVAASHNIRRPLVDALDRLIGQDDLVAVMTPEMAASSVAFARKTSTIDGFLTRYWAWGERNSSIPADPEDQTYGACYPNQLESSPCRDQNGVAAEMIDRRHERRTIDALQDLVRYLRGVREERKAVLAVSNGWLLYRPDQTLARPLNCHGVPTGAPPIGVDPRTSRLGARDPSTAAAPFTTCELDRLRLAEVDDDREFRDILDEANRANVSFYPIDPRGLAAFDTDIVRQDVPGPLPPSVPVPIDHRLLQSRLTSLRTLADATDGLAIINSNDLDAGLRRVTDDLSSYYLVGYYSTGRLDGKFHPISVRVNRPGVQVRARRGYLALTPDEARILERRTGGSATPASSAAEAEARAVAAAIGPLEGYTRDLPLRLQVAAGWKPGDAASAMMFVVGEISSAAATGESWSEGFEATATVSDRSDQTVASGRIAVARGARTFRIALTPSAAIAAGEYVLRVSARAGSGSIPTRETVRLTIPPAPASAGAIFLRRGPATANNYVPTADLRFRRNEQLRVEVPEGSGADIAARLLDRTGMPLNIPVAAARRDDPDGTRWLTAQLALAPLAPGDYAVQITVGSGGAGGSNRQEMKLLEAFRVVQ